MKRLFVVALLAVAVVLSGSLALAQNPVWMKYHLGDSWVLADPLCDATMEHSGSWYPQPAPGDLAVPCSDVYWTFCCLPCADVRVDGSPLTITTTAVVNQWLQAYFAGTDINWVIQHPGWFAADTLFLDIMSNDDIKVETSGSGNLLNEDPTAIGDTEIELWWGEGAGGIPVWPNWVPASSLDSLLPVIPLGDEADHDLVYHIWQKIHVEKCNMVGTYSNSFTVTFCPAVDP